jgi:hypothetical protein
MQVPRMFKQAKIQLNLINPEIHSKIKQHKGAQ